MPSIISATTTTGLVTTADNSGSLQLATNSGTTAVTIDTSQNVTFAKPITVGGNTLGAGDASSFKNRIINGAMTIDQRNAGASVTQTTSDLYPVDRFRIIGTVTSKFTAQQNAGSVTPPVGFTNYLGITSSSAYSVLTGDYFTTSQAIEGFNTADLQWGTANAKTVTLSFWVRSSLTGTFGGSLRNSAANRSYPFTYTISSANTWEYETITIAGDTSGTWVGATNGLGLNLTFGLGVGATFSGTAGAWAGSNFLSATGATSVVGTNGATFYITGVQLEVGSTATSFDYRPYGTEFQLCQRYFETNFNYGTAPAAGVSFANSSGHVFSAYTTSAARSEGILFAVPKRGTPNITFYRTSLTGSNNNSWDAYISGSWTNTSTATAQSTGASFTSFQADAVFSGMSTGSSYIGAGNWTASAEL